jgi:hypothetical protein
MFPNSVQHCSSPFELGLNVLSPYKAQCLGTECKRIWAAGGTAIVDWRIEIVSLLHFGSKRRHDFATVIWLQPADQIWHHLEQSAYLLLTEGWVDRRTKVEVFEEIRRFGESMSLEEAAFRSGTQVRRASPDGKPGTHQRSASDVCIKPRECPSVRD